MHLASFYKPSKHTGIVKMAARVAARSYENLSVKDIFGGRKSDSSYSDAARDISGNLWNECRFALPPGSDVSQNCICHRNLLSHVLLRYLFSLLRTFHFYEFLSQNSPLFCPVMFYLCWRGVQCRRSSCGSFCIKFLNFPNISELPYCEM
mgnify:CR=1 FL=1